MNHLPNKMSLTQVVCDLLKSNSLTVRKQLKEVGAFESIIQELVEFSTPLQDQQIILETLAELCLNRTFAKEFANTCDLADILHEVFFSNKVFREHILNISLNISKYMNLHDVEMYILPMISVDKFKNETSFNIFRHILTRPLKLDWFKSNKWIFQDLNRLLHDENMSKKTLNTLYEITKLCGYGGHNNRIADFLREGIWMTECREILLSLTLSLDKDISIWSQHILLNISYNIKNNAAIKCEFKEIEVHHFKKMLHTIYAFPIFFLCNLSQSKNVKLLMDNGNIRMIQNILIQSSENCALSLHASDLLIYAYCYYNIGLNFDEIKKYKSSFHFIKHVQQSEDGIILNRIKELMLKLDIPEDKKLAEKVENIKRHSTILDRLEKNGIELIYPHEYLCPITQDIMTDPVVASDGHSYEREALISFLKHGNGKSPLTREKLGKTMIPNINLKKRIREHAEDVCNLVETKKNKVN